MSSLTTSSLAAAEELLGLEFTEDERELVLASIELPLRAYAKRRQVELPNGLGPATGFTPVLPGMSFERELRPLVRSSPLSARVPTAGEDIAFAPLSQLSRWLERRELRSVELTRLYLTRLAKADAQLECVVTLTEDSALGAAERADAEIAAGRYRGPLHGVPWGAKDLLDTAGIATTFGAAPFRDRVPDEDAEVVRRLTNAGAVLVAKLSLGELAMGDVWFGGKTRNPWKLEQGSGGSSAGSAAAVAAGLVGFAIGSETLGSIANPSMTCGAVGLRPTFGRVPRTGSMTLCWSLDKLGPICRSVEDTAVVLDAIHGSHEGDPDAVDVCFGFDADAAVAGGRVGYVPEWFAEPKAGASEREALSALERSGLELVEITAPELSYEVVLTLLFVEAAAAFQELTLTNRDDELRQQEARSWPNSFRTAHYTSAVEYVQLQRLRRNAMGAMRDLFEQTEILVAPGMGAGLSPITNATGHPSLTLPVGFRVDGTPAALTLHGRLYDESTLCRVGMVLEAELGYSARPRLGLS